MCHDSMYPASGKLVTVWVEGAKQSRWPWPAGPVLGGCRPRARALLCTEAASATPGGCRGGRWWGSYAQGSVRGATGKPGRAGAY